MKSLILILLIITASPLFAEQKLPAASLMVHVTPEMLSPGFWISRMSHPDQMVLTLEDIEQFNQQLEQQQLIANIFQLVEREALRDLSKRLTQSLVDIEKQDYYTKENVRNDQELIQRLRHQMNLSGIVTGQNPSYGLVVRFTNQRILPTDEPLYEYAQDIEFDQLQNSGLAMGEAVALVHTSRDGKWGYVITSQSEGWVKMTDIALGDKSKVAEYVTTKDFVVITSLKADIFADLHRREFLGSIRMGQRLPLVGVQGDIVRVSLPQRDSQGKLVWQEGYIHLDDIHIGFLSYTPRHILEQSFKALFQTYGWGDMYQLADCSRLVAMVYATVGIQMPRNSSAQIQAGKLFRQFDPSVPVASKKEALEHLTPGVTLLGLKGHIMIYLGNDQGRYYVIHATSGYREKINDNDQMRVVHRVVVSDMSLGEGSRRGSLLERLNRIIEIR